jgi:hypothetical protein
MISRLIWKFIEHRRQLIPSFTQDLGLDLKQIGLDRYDPTQASQQQRKT